MTAQIGEKLIYEGKELTMCNEPLNSYFRLGGIKPEFESICTALWRGYVGTWEIINDRLYLVELSGKLSKGLTASLATVFPVYPDRVFAHWYSGCLRIPDGKLLEYVHMGYGSTYERDLIINIKKGVIIGKEFINKGESENTDGSEGYGVGAFTMLSGSKK